MKQNFRRLLLCLSLAAVPFLRMEALDWVPVGDAVDANGFATAGGTYHSRDVVAPDSPSNKFNRPLTTSSVPGADNTINMYGTLYTGAPTSTTAAPTGPTGIPCTLKVAGDVELTAIDQNMTINILEDVVLEPYFEQPAGGMAGGDSAQVYFNVAANQTITVNVQHNLEFRGKTTNDTGHHRDMIVTFAGEGQVVFNMTDGTSIWFNGQNDTSSPLVLDTNGLLVPCADRTVPSTDAAGTKVFVLMDQTYNDVYNNDKNKVVFQRTNAAVTGSGEANRVLVGVGPNSVFTYLSSNLTGLQVDPTSVTEPGYASVAFDPTNFGAGRMVLFIRGAYATDTDKFMPPGETPNPNYGRITEKYPFNDGAVIVGGSYVPNFYPATIAGSNLVGETETPAPGYDFTVPAGIRAVMRVVDNKLFTSAGSPNPYNPAAAQRRGLLVVNDVASHGKLASDPYWDLYAPAADGFIGTEFAYSNPHHGNKHRSVRKGFILAVNGLVDVYHNTFLDHIAGFANQCDPLASCDFADPNFLGNANWIKPRNPSAFIVDGLDTALFVDGNPYIPGSESAGAPSLFVAADPYTQVFATQAEMFMRGSGTVNFVSAASAKHGYLYNFWTSGTHPYFDGDAVKYLNGNNTTSDLDFTAVFDAGTSTYNGIQLAPTGLDVIQTREGNHVFDAEGPLYFVSFPNSAAGRNYQNLVENAGVFNAASLLLDYKGNEIFAAGVPVVRPLLADGTPYDRYNSPTLFFNNFVSFYDGSTLLQNDATKFVDGLPALSEPGMTGGERLWFGQQFWGATAGNLDADPNRFRFPEVQFFNSTLALHENLNASGLRFVVKSDTVEGLDNTSYVQFFDHGQDLDSGLTGFGRIFLCGSALNNFCDGASNVVGESCPFNVFTNGVKNPSGPFPVGAQVTLSLINGDEFTSDLLAAIAINPALKEKQRAHHLFMFSQPPHGAQGAVANLSVGWGANSLTSYTYTYPGGLNLSDPLSFTTFSGPGGDKGFFPGNFPYPGEPLITDPAFYTPVPTSLDALQVNPAIVSVDGSIICFGSFDQAGNSLPVPLKTDNDTGAVYVKHGGKLTITRQTPYVPGPGANGDRARITYQTFLSTMIGQRLWNDYNFEGDSRVVQLAGDLDLPHDQTVFDNNMAVQPYNITQGMFAARRFDTEGYVRLSFENTNRSPYFDTTGAEEVALGWFYRDTPDFTILPNNPPGTGGNIEPVKSTMLKTKLMGKPSKKTNWMTRAMESVDTPFPRPTDLLYVGPGDDIVQMQVAGATQSDPFVLDVSGDNTRPVNARVREFVSLKSTRSQVADHFIGEGEHATLYVEYNGRFGLGSRKWNENSVNAWNVLGKDFVTICPLGDGTIDLNDDVLVADRQALIASTTFGQGEVNRLTFTSDQPREIRVPAGMELDLSSFGKSDQQQQISFGGQVKLIFEEGATLRLSDAAPFVNPDTHQTTGGLILYFNDQAQLVFEGGSQGNTYLPFIENGTGADASATSANARVRIVGQGQIWLNKNAQILVNDTALVGVESDVLTPTTNVTISIIRQGAMYIGTDTVSGGAFQVGNPADQTSTGGNVAFTLALNGPTANLHIDREGFFGLGAGVFNKNGNINGTPVGANPVVDGNGVAVPDSGFPQFNPDTNSTGAWQIKPLFNVASVSVQLAQGIFDHSNIFDGSSSNASLMAVGPAGSFAWSQGNGDVVNVRGGGNLMLVPTVIPNNVRTQILDSNLNVIGFAFRANVWNYAGQLIDGESYGVLASGALLLDRQVPGDLNAVVTHPAPLFNIGRGATFTFTGGANNDANAAAAFGLFNFVPFNLQGALANTAKRVDLGTTAFVTSVDFELQNTPEYPSASFAGAEIRRQASPSTLGGGTFAEAVNRGSLNAIGDTSPSNFTSAP